MPCSKKCCGRKRPTSCISRWLPDSCGKLPTADYGAFLAKETLDATQREFAATNLSVYFLAPLASIQAALDAFAPGVYTLPPSPFDPLGLLILTKTTDVITAGVGGVVGGMNDVFSIMTIAINIATGVLESPVIALVARDSTLLNTIAGTPIASTATTFKWTQTRNTAGAKTFDYEVAGPGVTGSITLSATLASSTISEPSIRDPVSLGAPVPITSVNIGPTLPPKLAFYSLMSYTATGLTAISLNGIGYDPTTGAPLASPPLPAVITLETNESPPTSVVIPVPAFLPQLPGTTRVGFHGASTVQYV